MNASPASGSTVWGGRRSSSAGTSRRRCSVSIHPIGAPSTIMAGGLFEQTDCERLSAALQRLQGRFILSLNDVPEVRELFAWASIETVELSYQAGGAGHTKRVREVVISG